MAKLKTKSEVRDFAKKTARTIPVVNDKTRQELEALSWEDRRKVARQLAIEIDNLATTQEVVHELHRDHFRREFEDVVLDIWGSKIQEHQRKVKRYLNALQGTRLDDASKQVIELVRSMNIRGMKLPSEAYYLSFGIGRNGLWIDGSFTVSFDRAYDSDKKIVNPDNPQQAVGYYEPKVTLSWGSTTRSVADAVAAIKLYNDLINAAAEVESFLGQLRIIWTYGIEETKTEEVAQ